ncbi:MAG TPA: DegQ family serine endoprotease [Gammaproteobacteria bacterium]|nr:DegQ family serine endoprotease [Gammaproteobacteria bacterium]
MNRKTFFRVAVALAIVPAVAAGYLYLQGPVIAQAHAESAVASATPAIALPDVSSLVERTGPAVVAIRVTQTMHNAGLDNLPPGIDRNSPFFYFFRRFGPPSNGDEGDQTMQGIGSGFIISPDGYILTNAHVVADASEVQVKLTDKREFTAKVVGVDKKSDIAVIKIDAHDLPVLHPGNSDTLKVGEWVAAIGTPFGLENTVTVGVVSAKGRALPDEAYVPFIQTDVALNPGNSGGPLLNMKGEVVGVNSQIYSRSGGYMGLSFAIPIDVAMKIGDELRHDGKVAHGLLGVSVQSMTQDLAKSFGLGKTEGALISRVEPDSPASKAGLQTGDVILGVNGKTINDSIDLSRIIADSKPGDVTTLRILRNGGEKTVRATIGESPADEVADAGGGKAHSGTGRLGLAVRSLNQDEQHQIDEKGGVLVEQASGPAAKAGIQPGDVILAVNNKRVKDPQELRSLVEHASGHVALLVRRNDAEIYVPVAIG